MHDDKWCPFPLELSKLHEHESLSFLLTRRLNQDPLENFFGTIRQQGGNADNPTPLQFTRAFRKLFYDNYLLSSGNCANDFDCSLVGAPSSTKTIKNSSGEKQNEQSKPFLVDDTDFKTCLDNVVGMNALTYLAGYLLKKCLAKHSCQVCQNGLTSNKLASSNQLLCLFMNPMVNLLEV